MLFLELDAGLTGPVATVVDTVLNLPATALRLRPPKADQPETRPKGGWRPAHIGWQIAGLTDVGLERELNEDNLLLMEAELLNALPCGLYVVADGLGGQVAGEVASRVTGRFSMACSNAKRLRGWGWALGCMAFVLGLLLALLPSADPSHAADFFLVDSTLDEGDANIGDGVCASTSLGQCTLRAAVEEGQAVNRAVVVPAGLYELSLGHLSIKQNLTLTGAGSGKTLIDGALKSRIFDIEASGFAYISDVTIQWGKGDNDPGFAGHYHGGAIHNHGTLILVDSTVRASSSNNGGWGGGGIFNAGGATAILQNVTITGNSTWANGGGIENSGILNLYNGTIVNNQAFGSSTSGGGIYGNGLDTWLKNTLVANNFDGGNCGGTISDNGFNLDSGDTCSFPGDRSNLDLKLGGRDENDTYPLLPGSPAIDSGTDADCPTTDQRGVTRPQDGDSDGVATCDVGAYEVVPPDLQISFMSDSPDPVQAGDSLIYLIDVYNPGPSALTNIELTDTLPAGVTYTGFAETRGGNCAHAAGIVTCNLGVLDGDRVWTIYLYTTVDPTTSGTVINLASVTSTGIDPDPSNNSWSESTIVNTAPSWSIYLPLVQR